MRIVIETDEQAEKPAHPSNVETGSQPLRMQEQAQQTRLPHRRLPVVDPLAKATHRMREPRRNGLSTRSRARVKKARSATRQEVQRTQAGENSD
jgi:hypothetical protein